MKQAHPKSTGGLVFLSLDLNDLSTIKKTAEVFLAAESRLDVLWLNAGVMVPPKDAKTAQGHELQFGTNNIAHFLLVKYLKPLLSKTAAVAPADSVRVIWVSSSVGQSMAPKPAIDFENMDYKKDEMVWTRYGRSKAGNILQATEFARQTKDEGIISIVRGAQITTNSNTNIYIQSLNPGNLKTGLQRHLSPLMRLLIVRSPIIRIYHSVPNSSC